MAAKCHDCGRLIANGESAWARDWTVIDDASNVRTETRHTCDDCEATS